MTGPYDFWLFDLDGTLVDVEWDYVRTAFDRVGDRLDRPFRDAEAERLWHGLSGSRNAQLRRWGIEPTAFWEAFHAVECPTERAASTYLHEDAAFVADVDVPTGIVTHCRPFLTEPVLEHLDVADWFDVVVCCSDETGWKPDARPVERALDALDVTPGTDRGVLAGDNDTDVGAAWNAGLEAILVDRFGPSHRGHCVRGDYRIERFDELEWVAPSPTAGHPT